MKVKLNPLFEKLSGSVGSLSFRHSSGSQQLIVKPWGGVSDHRIPIHGFENLLAQYNDLSFDDKTFWQGAAEDYNRIYYRRNPRMNSYTLALKYSFDKSAYFFRNSCNLNLPQPDDALLWFRSDGAVSHQNGIITSIKNYARDDFGYTNSDGSSLPLYVPENYTRFPCFRFDYPHTRLELGNSLFSDRLQFHCVVSKVYFDSWLYGYLLTQGINGFEIKDDEVNFGSNNDSKHIYLNKPDYGFCVFSFQFLSASHVCMLLNQHYSNYPVDSSFFWTAGPTAFGQWFDLYWDNYIRCDCFEFILYSDLTSSFDFNLIHGYLMEKYKNYVG